MKKGLISVAEHAIFEPKKIFGFVLTGIFRHFFLNFLFRQYVSTIFNGIIVPEREELSSLRSSSDVSFLSDTTFQSSPNGIRVPGVGLFRDL